MPEPQRQPSQWSDGQADAADQHQALARAIVERDPDAAMERGTEHLTTVERNLIDRLV